MFAWVVRLPQLAGRRYLAACLLTLAWAGTVAAAPAGPVTLNFVDADLDVVAKAIGELTGKTFVLDARAKGKINIQSARGIPASAAYPTFLAALRMAGFAAVEGPGNVVRIVPEADAKTLAGPLGATAAGAFATRVIPIAHQSATQIANAIRPLVAAANAVTVYAPGNVIIISDYSDNLRRIEALIERLDVPQATFAEVIPLAHASAVEVLATLQRVFAEPPAEPRERIVFATDARTNAIIVRTEDAARLSRVRALIEQLDRPSAVPGNLRIVYLKHADATQVAQTLRRVLGAEGATAASAAAPSGPPPASTLAPLQGATAAGSGVSGATPGLAQVAAALTGGAASAASAPPTLPAAAPVAFTAAGATVYADPSINALVISAPTAVYNNLRAVIEQLDVRRAQVFIEALIVEVQADRAAEFGIQWQAIEALARDATRGFAGTNFGGAGQNILGVSAEPTTVGRGLNVGIVSGALTIGRTRITNLGLLARALQNDLQANVLSMPTLLTLDNEEARFSGGQNVPFLTGQYAQTGSSNTVTPFQTIERRDVGLTLRVRPLITEGGSIRLQLYQEVSNVVESAAAAVGLANINKRVLESTVLVEDGQIVVLGGLLQEGYSSGEEKVPLLGDAPLVGSLFRYDTRKRQKTNLMLFLRPTVIRTPAQLGALANERYRQLGLEREANQPEPRAPLPNFEPPPLPLGAPPPR
ncbi:MAG: type II secretion system secretin GspD [Burkholderiales bacterium]|nr:type II secretion system secretin GspD [Burkholderiales bacterium]